MEVCYPGRDVPWKTILGVDFVVNITALESKGIDFILGIDWLIKDKGLTNCAAKAVKLTSDDGKRME
jgi:hypothetical protein